MLIQEHRLMVECNNLGLKPKDLTSVIFHGSYVLLRTIWWVSKFIFYNNEIDFSLSHHSMKNNENNCTPKFELNEINFKNDNKNQENNDNIVSWFRDCLRWIRTERILYGDGNFSIQHLLIIIITHTHTNHYFQNWWNTFESTLNRDISTNQFENIPMLGTFIKTVEKGGKKYYIWKAVEPSLPNNMVMMFV